MQTFISDISTLYSIKEEIGQGGFSTVYKAFDIINNRECALKIFRKYDIEEGNKKKYLINSILMEIEMMKKLKCKNVVELYNAFETKENYILVMELCDTDLNRYIHNYKEHQDILVFIHDIFLELNNAFKIMTMNNIVHRDIKPQNIFLKFENGKIIPKLSDFGISRRIEKSIQNDSEDLFGFNKTFVGTPNFMAPEMLKEEKYNYKCDLYSLGVTLYYLYFKTFPYSGHTPFELLNKIKSKEDFLKSGVMSFDDLLDSLLIINPNKRIDWTEYFDHPFFKEDSNSLKNYKYEKFKIVDEQKKNDNNLDKMNNIAKVIFDIMSIPNVYTDKKEKNPRISNILYYDENINKHLEEIHQDCDYFERKTPGTFILSSNIFSLNLIMEEIKKYYTKFDDRVIFNLIVTGSKCEKVMDNLIKYNYDKFIQNICIYCMKIKKYSYLKKKYSKIIGIYNEPSKVEEFIQNVSKEQTKEFPMLKIIDYNIYKDLYYDRHQKISQFYGNLTKETYEKSLTKFETFIDSKKDTELKIKKDILIKSFKTFDLSKDLEVLDKILIQEYTKNTFYGDLNNWLRTLDNQVYEAIAYYTARLMYSLNNYALKTNNFYDSKTLVYRGAKTNYINLLAFERLKGKIVIFSSFTSTSEHESIALDFASRDKAKEIFKEYHKFSVIYKITNFAPNNCVPCGINIQNEAVFKEKEILFQPFTFYLVKNVDFNFDNYTVDIELEVIPKKEILEEKIREGKKVIYDKKLNMMLIDED